MFKIGFLCFKSVNEIQKKEELKDKKNGLGAERNGLLTFYLLFLFLSSCLC